MHAAAEEERFRRIKHVAGFPREAIRACLAMAGITGRDIDHVAVSRDPRANIARKAWYAATVLPTGRLLRDRANNYRQVGAIPDTPRPAKSCVQSNSTGGAICQRAANSKIALDTG